jgi:hypothetical protein
MPAATAAVPLLATLDPATSISVSLTCDFSQSNELSRCSATDMVGAPSSSCNYHAHTMISRVCDDWEVNGFIVFAD